MVISQLLVPDHASKQQHFIHVVSNFTKTFYGAPIMWNNLPDSLRSINSMEHFKSALKTYLFELSL